jgi:hypothetical protein
MNRFRLSILTVLLAGAICGCSPHYYRSTEDGVAFFLRKPDAKQVILYTSLDGFAPHITENKDGLWFVILPSGREFCYFYEIDGEVYTPWCYLTEKDSFGMKNCVYAPDL